MDNVEKIYTTDGSNNFASGAMMGASLNNNNNDALTAMLANGNNQAMWNNPFAYLIWLIFAGQFGGFGGNGAYQTQLQSLQNQIADNHNSDLTMQAINGNQAALTQLAQTINVSVDQVTAAINAMNNGLNTSIISQGYLNLLNNCNQTNTILMQSLALLNTVLNGITALGYQSERNSSAAQQSSNANTQRIIDTLNNHWNLEQQTTIQQLRDEIGRLNQTNTLITSLKGTTTATSTVAA